MKRWTFDLGDGATYSIVAMTETEARLRLAMDGGIGDFKLLSMEDDSLVAQEENV